MSKKKSFTRWAITGECGLYIGQRLTRRGAIAEHVSAKFAGVSPYAGNGLDDSQRSAWDRCLRLGDRAVKVRITVQ
jgi:hypothetical protein